MSGKNLNFGDKKNFEKWLLQKQKSTDDIDKILVSKEEPHDTILYWLQW